MPEAGEVAATRVALLELRDERRLVHEGYELLDEKRVLLAAEILRQSRRYAELAAETKAQWAVAREAFVQAVEIHGFEDLSAQPPCSFDTALLQTDSRSFLGIELVEAHLQAPTTCTHIAPPVLATPELTRCAEAFRGLVLLVAEAAACGGNLRRLAQEYRRTERRARALENILLPEIDGALHFIEEQLDAVDQEEAVRVRNAARGR